MTEIESKTLGEQIVKVEEDLFITNLKKDFYQERMNKEKNNDVMKQTFEQLEMLSGELTKYLKFLKYRRNAKDKS